LHILAAERETNERSGRENDEPLSQNGLEQKTPREMIFKSKSQPTKYERNNHDVNI